MIGLVGYERGRRSRTPVRTSTDERQPLPRLRSVSSTLPTSRPSFFRFHYDEPPHRSPPAIRRRSPSPLQRRPQEPASPPPHQQSFSSTNLPYDPLNPLQPPITVFGQPATSVQSSIPVQQHHTSTTINNPIVREPTSPISSGEAASSPDKRPKSPSPIAPPSGRSRVRSDLPSLLFTRSLPPSRRRRRHRHRSRAHRQITEPITAVIRFIPTVTLIEAPSIDISDNAILAPRRPKDMACASSPAAGTMNLSAKSKSTNPNETKQMRTREKGQRSSQPAHPPIQEVVPDSTSEYTYLSVSSDSEESDTSRKHSAKPPPKKDSILSPVQIDTIMLKARVLTTMASDESVSLQDLDNYLKKADLHFFNPKSCSDEKPYKCICSFGPPKVGKSEAASSLNTYMNGVRQSTTSTKFYKWTCERNNTHFFTTRTAASQVILGSTGVN